MRIKVVVLAFLCSGLIACRTSSGPKQMYTSDLTTGDVNVPVTYIGGLETLKTKTNGTLMITNAYTTFLSETRQKLFEMPTKSVKGVYINKEVERKFGKTLARWLVIGVFSLFFKDKSETMAIEFQDPEKNLIFNPIFQIKVGTGPTLKRTIEIKAGISTPPTEIK